jgi:SAM-dependent methyltransferase
MDIITTDIFGKALADYPDQSFTLFIETSYGEIEEMPIDVFFRKPKSFPAMEKFALSLCKGKILDIGAGVGAHAQYLQSKNRDVTALEISGTAVEIMKKKGIYKVIEADIFNFTSSSFDTLLLMMNGIGIAGTIDGLNRLLSLFKKMLNPGGIVIFDSSDIRYLYEGQEIPIGKYFGEISYRYLYKEMNGPWFDWIYVCQKKMGDVAKEQGFNFEVIAEDDSGQYLAILYL